MDIEKIKKLITQIKEDFQLGVDEGRGETYFHREAAAFIEKLEKEISE